MDQLHADVRLALENAARGIDHVEDKRAPQNGGGPGGGTGGDTDGNNDSVSSSSSSSSVIVASSTANAQATSTRASGEFSPPDSNSASSVSTSAATTTSTTKNSTATATHKPSSGGISTGAIVGIVVGVVGGLLVIGGIAFFILRKRRRSKDLSGGYDGTDAAGTFMVDKETQGRATDSPNSPYTDENQARDIPIENSTRDLPPHVGVPRTSTGGSHDGAHSSRAQTPQGVSSNVAHLVEDGMTAEEIRRLEEEERQLDDEIERAARR